MIFLVPVRMCIACRGTFDKLSLIRLARRADGAVSIDFAQKLPGRGAYICRSEKCISRAEGQKGFERALKSNISSDIYRKIKEDLINSE